MKKFTSLRLRNLASNIGLLKLGLVILACFVAEVGRAQFTFATAQVLPGDAHSITNDNASAVRDGNAPNIAGFPANKPLWYQWTPTVDGEVELDTIGSVNHTNGTPLNTVLGVFTGTSLTTLNQVAANDDLFPINSSIPLSTEGYNYSGSGDYAHIVGPGGSPFLSYIQPYYGPSHLRFNAKAGTTYYIAVDSQNAISFLGVSLGNGPGTILLHWAYKSSGVFRFASEDVDYWTGLPTNSPYFGGGHLAGYPLYQAAETESDYRVHYVPVGNAVLHTYYSYNVPGVLVTVTRVAGSSGRATVDYRTVDGANLPVLPNNDVAAVAGVDYGYAGNTNPISGTLIFDDYEMSKTILIPIINPSSHGGYGSGGYTNNTVFGVQLVDDGGVTSPTLDPGESSAVAPPRVDPSFSLALVKILNVSADPYGPDLIPVVTTNGWYDFTNTPPTNPVLGTNYVIGMPTNPIVSFQKCNFRVPEDVNDTSNNPNGYTTPVTIYVARSPTATNRSAITLHYRINNFINSDADPDEEWNNWFPLQPGSDYAVPTPPNYATILATNSDFNMVQGTITFPANGVDAVYQPITFTVTNSTLTKFNRDFKVELYQMITVGSQSVPALAGMVGETTVTILFNDQHPPAGSVDEFYNADWNGDLAVPPTLVPPTLPPNDDYPGVSGVVNSLLVLPNNKTLIAGDFLSYNGSTYPDAKSVNCIALIDTTGALDSSFEPVSGASGPIDSLASSPGNQFVIGGAFLSFNGEQHYRIARVNADGSLDTGFNPTANGTVWAAAVQPDGGVLIGGDFNNVNGQPRHHLARLKADGTLDTTFDPGTTLNGPVYAIALPPLITLNFQNSGFGETNQTINLGMATAGTLTVNYNMYLIQADDMKVFYGDTNVAGGTGVLIFDTGSVFGTNSFVLPFGPINGLTTNVITIVMDQGAGQTGNQWTYNGAVTISSPFNGMFVGGDFGVSGHSYADIARFTTNGSLDTTFNPTAGANNPINTLGWQLDGKLVVGGSFTFFNGAAMNRVARLNGNGSLDTTNFFVGTGANDVVWNITLQPLDGTMYVGGQFSSFNGTHRLGFTRLYANGTVDTTFLDTAYNQFAGLKRVYSWQAPAVYASGVQSDGNVIIGGTFDQVGGGQADTNVCNTLDDKLGIDRSFNDPNLWVEPKTRDGVRNRSSVARLIGGSTPGPGNIGLQNASSSANKSGSVLSVGLVRTNGMLGPVSANFSVQPGTAQSGRDFSYNGTPPLFWVAWRFTTSTQTRLRSDGLFGDNGSLMQDVFSYLSLPDKAIKKQSAVTVSVIKNNQTSGNLDAQFQLANPSGADEFYLGGQNIPLGAALGVSAAPFTVIDDNKNAGVVGFVSPVYIATNINAVIGLVRSNGIYGTITMTCSTSNGTAIAGVDYIAIPLTPPTTRSFGPGVTTNSFTVTNLPAGLIYTNFTEKFYNLRLTSLTGPSDGNVSFGLSNAVVRLINTSFQGYLTLSATNYTGSESAGFISFVVNRVAGSYGTITVQYATTDGPTATNNMDYFGATNTLQWNSGDTSPRTVSISLTNTGTVGTNKSFHVLLSNPTLNTTNWPSLFYIGTPPTNSITNATLTIANDNSYGQVQFSAPSYLVNENGGYATITVVRTGGTAGPVSVNFTTRDGSNTSSNVNYAATSGVLTFAANQTAASFNVSITNDLVQDPASFYFNVTLSNPTNTQLGSPTNAMVYILDVQSHDQPPGSPDGTFTAGMNGDVLALALQTNGQILAGGNFTFVNGTPENSIARLNADGSLDSAGFLNGYSGANGAVQAIVCQRTDSRVVIGGAFNSVDDIARNHIARLMTDGSLDTSFNPGPGADGPVYALAETFVNGGNKIYVGGAFSSISGGTSPNFARLITDSPNGGTLDPSFNAGSGPNGAVFAVAVYPTNSPFAGKVLIGGAFTNVNNFALNHIARLNGDGSVDTNFDLNWGANDTIRAIVIQIDGRILIGGDFTNVNGVALNHVARLNTGGTLDTNFVANVGAGVNSTVQAIAVQADNRIVLAGQFTQDNGITRNRITRLLPNGAVDTTINFGDGANGTIDALVIQPTNQLFVIGGSFTQYDDQPHAHIARIYGGSVTGSGLLQFTSAAYQVDENGGQALITVSRTGGTSGPNTNGTGNITVYFSTTDGTAVAGTNYTGVTNYALSFPPGEVLETAVVQVRDDGVVTPDLTVNLAITNPTAPAGLGAQSTAVLTIINDDSAVSFSNANYSVSKNVLTGFAPIDVIRLGTTNGTCSVYFITTTNGTAVTNVDFIPINTNITFNPGDSIKEVQVPILNNPLPTGNRTVIFTLTNAVNAVLFSPSNATLTINDTVVAPGQLCFSATNYAANEGDGSAIITVVRTNGTSGSVSVAYTTTNGTAQSGLNYITTSGTLTFNNGDTAKTFAVPLVDNNLVQGTVNLYVLLSNPSGGATLIAPTNATLSISDNDVGFSFVNATNLPVSETNAFASVLVQCIGSHTNSVQVYYATTNGTAIAGVNYTAVSGWLTFTSGETRQAILVPLIDVPTVTGDLTFTVNLSSNSVGTQLVAPSNSVVVVQDADAGLSFTNSVASVLKNAGSLVVAVVCSNTNAEPVIVYSNGVPVTTPLSVHYSTADGTALAGLDYTAVSGTLVFTNGIATNTFTVPILNNSLVMGDRTFTVSLSNPTPPGQLVPPSVQTVTIIDNNSGLSFSSSTYTVLKTGVAATITVLRVDNTNTVSSVDFATANGTALAGLDYIATNGTFVFTNGETSKTFSVIVINNTVVQPDKTVLLQLSNPTGGILMAPYIATLTIHDTGGSFVVPAGSTLISESGPTNGIIDPGETVTLLFAFRAAGGTNVTDLKATLLPINGIASPSAGAPYYGDYGPLIVGGPSVSRPFTFTVSPGYTNGQQIVATFKLQDGTKNIGTNGFTYTLGAWTATFSNTAAIIINDMTIATPYPSIINVSNVGGVVIKATVTLTNLSHGSVYDIDALLVAPNAQDTLLMSHVGTLGFSASHITLTFDDAANSLTNTGAITSGTNKPTAYPPSPLFP
jgi:uncharacterized delta-60 repeat protein